MHPQPSAALPSILIADDDEFVRTTLDLGLRQAGFRPLLAAGGREAVALFRRHQDEVRAVLLDVTMPGLDGPGALAQIRQIDPQVPCCFMTGYSADYSAEGLLVRGAARVFDKPFRLDEVIESLGKLCGRPR